MSEGENGTSVSMKDYVDSRFMAVETATKAALAEQKEALSTALNSQQRELAAVSGVKHAVWGYIVAALGLLAAIATAFVRHT